MKRLATLLIGAATIAAQAQTVYRCGNAYSQTPCAEARVIDATDTRTDAQRADALRVADDQRRLGDQMARDRLAEQRHQHPAGAARLSAAPLRQVVVLEKVRPLNKKRVSHKPSSTFVVAVDPDTGAKRRN